jgi:hypothetical protein
MTRWPPETDPFYTEHGDKFVCVWWNGIAADSRGAQENRFLSSRTPPMGEYALSTPWPDCGILFTDEMAAREFLERQDTLRPHPLGAGWDVVPVGELEQRYGYRCLTAAITVGRSREVEIDTSTGGHGFNTP